MTKPKIEYYIVKLKRPKGVSQKEMQRYLLDAINGWNGQFFYGDSEEPADSLFGCKCEKVTQIK